jgi:LysR family transcriptional regulator, hca operon transcriptional activator
MELRHLRYFIAVAEEGSLTLAAEKRLHTAQPSLSRQIRDLEYEVGVQLMTRSVHGIELTAAGKVAVEGCVGLLGTAQLPAAGFNSVSIGPGWILLTVIPRLPTSLDNP